MTRDACLGDPAAGLLLLAHLQARHAYLPSDVRMNERFVSISLQTNRQVGWGSGPVPAPLVNTISAALHCSTGCSAFCPCALLVHEPHLQLLQLLHALHPLCRESLPAPPHLQGAKPALHPQGKLGIDFSVFDDTSTAEIGMGSRCVGMRGLGQREGALQGQGPSAWACWRELSRVLTGRVQGGMVDLCGVALH